ncbi:unnamed protein product [Amoebophrya sp. A25]|nr:unnamed protein product [Amoebophrya sp. A25]|eukprot:GSA25T00026026001.1
MSAQSSSGKGKQRKANESVKEKSKDSKLSESVEENNGNALTPKAKRRKVASARLGDDDDKSGDELPSSGFTSYGSEAA